MAVVTSSISASVRADKELLEFFSPLVGVKGVTMLGSKKVGFEFKKEVWMVYRSTDFSQPPLLYRLVGGKWTEVPVSVAWQNSMSVVEFVKVAIQKN